MGSPSWEAIGHMLHSCLLGATDGSLILDGDFLFSFKIVTINILTYLWNVKSDLVPALKELLVSWGRHTHTHTHTGKCDVS